MFLRKLKCERGSATVEFALTAPLLLAVTFGVGDFGVAMYKNEALTNAAREGARYGIVLQTPRRTTGAIQTAVTNYLTNANITSGYSVTIPAACVNTGDDLSVTVSYSYGIQVLHNVLNLIHAGTTFPSMITLQAKAVMKCE